MAYPIFYPAYEQDHNPSIDLEADIHYQQAKHLENAKGIRNWSQIIYYYQQAIKLNHWKAMNNLALIYLTGKYDPQGNLQSPLGVSKDLPKTLILFQKMVELNVPLGYYNWGIALEKGWVTDPNDPAAASKFMFHAASLGSPLAQVRLGNFFAFVLPKIEQRDDLAESYFKCAGAQEHKEALIEVAGFYKVAKDNMPRALYYYQKAASLGSKKSLLILEEAFNQDDIYQFGYVPNHDLATVYSEMHDLLRENPTLKFPNLLTDYPLPSHPTQGYDAETPSQRPY